MIESVAAVDALAWRPCRRLVSFFIEARNQIAQVRLQRLGQLPVVGSNRHVHLTRPLTQPDVDSR